MAFFISNFFGCPVEHCLAQKKPHPWVRFSQFDNEMGFNYFFTNLTVSL